MISELEEKSDHTFTLKEGTLYPILHGLENQGAVKAYEQQAPSGRARRYYHITQKGLRLLEERKAEWNTFSAKVNAVIAGCSMA
jgi:PadR family transcriptional regulator PadR